MLRRIKKLSSPLFVVLLAAVPLAVALLAPAAIASVSGGFNIDPPLTAAEKKALIDFAVWAVCVVCNALF